MTVCDPNGCDQPSEWGHWARKDPLNFLRQALLRNRLTGGDSTDDSKPRKRGRPPKTRAPGIPESPTSIPSQQSTPALSSQHRTPQLQTQPLPPQVNITPTQPTPPKPTPTKSVLKALPTVRDHTTDQLNAEGDEYIPREHDEQGEQKVAPTGHPLGGREYKCRTFLVPNRGDKLFMLATECARVLSYRDSYLLFNKNRSLYKIIATQPEKDDLIGQEILPYSYRSRQIAIVTAKSMFRQFGSRVIQNGRRVRDDYWEAKARKQGFTEEDLAGEKRPGAAKARDAASAEAANAASVGVGHPDIIYSSGPIDSQGQPQALRPGLGGILPAAGGLPMIHLAPSEDLRPRDYSNIPRPRQEIAGAPYQDRTQPSSATEIKNQAIHTAEFSKMINQQRNIRGKDLTGYWNKPREIPVTTPLKSAETSPVVTQSLRSPQSSSSGLMGTSQQPMIQHQGSQIMSPPAYSQQSHQGATLAQSPIRSVPQSIRAEQLHQRSTALSFGSTGAGQPAYGYPHSTHAWGQPPPQPHQSPISSHHALSQYSPSPQPHSSHPSPSPHQPPQLHHPQSNNSSLHGGLNYQGMTGMGSTAYSSMGARGMYQHPSPSPQQYIQQQQSQHQQQHQQHQQQQQQTTSAQQASMQGWAPPPPQPGQHPGQQGWPGPGY